MYHLKHSIGSMPFVTSDTSTMAMSLAVTSDARGLGRTDIASQMCTCLQDRNLRADPKQTESRWTLESLAASGKERKMRALGPTEASRMWPGTSNLGRALESAVSYIFQPDAPRSTLSVAVSPSHLVCHLLCGVTGANGFISFHLHFCLFASTCSALSPLVPGLLPFRPPSSVPFPCNSSVSHTRYRLPAVLPIPPANPGL